MKKAIILLFVCAAAFGANPDQYSSGQGSLRALLNAGSLFTLAEPYIGDATLVYHRGLEKQASEKVRKLRFTHFIPHANRFSDPGFALPNREAILEAKPLDGENYSTGNFTFREKNIPTVEQISKCMTRAALNRLIPNLTNKDEEGDLEPTYLFNCFSLGENDQIDVLLLIAHCDEKGKIDQLDVWTGNLIPQK